MWQWIHCFRGQFIAKCGNGIGAATGRRSRRGGLTGPDLINRDQPVFVLASTVLTADDCRAMLDEHFDSNRNGEIKHARLAKTKRERAQLLHFFEALLRAPEEACFHANQIDINDGNSRRGTEWAVRGLLSRRSVSHTQDEESREGNAFRSFEHGSHRTQ